MIIGFWAESVSVAETDSVQNALIARVANTPPCNHQTVVPLWSGTPTNKDDLP